MDIVAEGIRIVVSPRSKRRTSLYPHEIIHDETWRACRRLQLLCNSVVRRLYNFS